MRGTKSLVLVLLLLLIIVGITSTRITLSNPDVAIYVDPPEILDVEVGNTFDIYVTASDIVDLFLAEIRLSWDPPLLYTDIDSINLGDVEPFLDYIYIEEVNNDEGWLHVVVGRPLMVKEGLNGTVQIAKITFLVEAEGSCPLHFFDNPDVPGVEPRLKNFAGVDMERTVEDGYFSGWARAKTISYNASTNIITVNDSSENDSIGFADLYNADLNGSLLLMDNATQGQDQSLDAQIRPADSGASQLRLEVLTYSAPKGDIRLNGTDFFDNTITESIEISGVGNYSTSNNYKTIYSGGIDIDPDITVDIWQSRWGVIWQGGDNQFTIDCRIIIGNGTATTWFKDSEKQVTFSDDAITSPSQRYFEVKAYGHLVMGILENASLKTSSRGVAFLTEEGNVSPVYFVKVMSTTNSEASFYSSMFNSIWSSMPFYGTNLKIYNSILNYKSYIYDQATTEIFNTIITGATGASGALYRPSGSYDKISIIESSYVAYLRPSGTISNLYARGCDKFAYVSFLSFGDFYFIDVDSDTWQFEWGAPSQDNIIRQYSFDLTVFFQNGSYAQNANVTISNSYLGTSDSWLTYANGSVPQQTYSMGHYNQTGGDTIYDYNPYNLTVTLDGYETYTDLINITKKEDLRITLTPKVVLLQAGDQALPWE